MVTPFKANGDVDYVAFRTLARYLVEHGSDGLVVTGSTGEAPTLSDRRAAAALRRRRGRGRRAASVIASTGTYDTAPFGRPDGPGGQPRRRRLPRRRAVLLAAARTRDRGALQADHGRDRQAGPRLQHPGPHGDQDRRRDVRAARPRRRRRREAGLGRPRRGAPDRGARAPALRGRRQPAVPVPPARWDGRGLRPHPHRRACRRGHDPPLPRRRRRGRRGDLRIAGSRAGRDQGRREPDLHQGGAQAHRARRRRCPAPARRGDARRGRADPRCARAGRRARPSRA